MTRIGGLNSNTEVYTAAEVDTKVSDAVATGAPNATSTTPGKVQLTGDLGGTATSPTVPGLATKADYNLSNINDENVARANLGAQSKTYVVVGTADADYVCDGTNDNVELQAALDFVNTAGGGTVFVKKGTYNLAAKLTIGSNTQLIGESITGTILKSNAGINTHVLENKNTTTGNSFISVRNLTLDQNGNNQTTGGNGAHFQGITDCTIENVVIERSYSFNLFINSVSGTALTGTLTFTNGSETVSGSGTAFTTELAVGSIIKSPAGNFQRVQAIASNTSLTLDRQWGWATESTGTSRVIPANARNKILYCEFKGNGDNDNVGLGLFDDSLVQGNVSHNATGYGFGPDHANRVKFVGNTSYSNVNGFGIETCSNCIFSSNVVYGNSQNGFYLLSGSYRNTITGNQSRQNTYGIQVQYNSTTYPIPDENTIVGNVCSYNSTHGIRVGGSSRTLVSNNKCFNNGNGGIVLATDNSVVPTYTLITGNQCYDNQTTKTQQRGIWVASGTNTTISDNQANTADHTTAGVTDAGTNTVILNTNAQSNVLGRTYLGVQPKAFVVVAPTWAADYTTDGTNDNVEIQAAIDAVTAAGGGVVYLKSGTYTLGATVNLKNNVTLMGEGWATTKVVLSSSFTLKVSGQNKIRVTGLRIDGDAMSASNVYCFYAENCTDIVFDHNYVENATGFGVFVASNASNITKNIWVTDNYVQGKGLKDVIGGGPANSTGAKVTEVFVERNTVIQNSTLGSSHKDAINFVGVYRLHFNDNIVEGSVLFGSEQFPHKYSTIQNNIIRRALGASRAAVGLILDPAHTDTGEASVFTGNTIEGGFLECYSNPTTPLYKSIIISNNVINCTGAVTQTLGEAGIVMVNTSFPTITNNSIFSNYVAHSVASATDVNTTTDVITKTAHGLQTGYPVLYTAGSAAITGLTTNTNYYVIRVDADTFKLATTQALANAGTAIDLTGAGTGTQTFTLGLVDGIWLKGVTNANVANNTIRDLGGWAYKESNSSDNNFVTGNIFSNTVLGTFTGLGSSTQAFMNKGDTRTMPTAYLGTGTASSSTFLRGDGAWTVPTFVRVIHGSTASTARPAATHVEWVGSVAPTNGTTADTWVDTT